MLEFALVAPSLILLSVAAMDLARVYRSAMAAAAASRAGVEYASSSVVAMDDVQGIIRAATTEAGSSANVKISASHYCTCSLGGPEQTCTDECLTRLRYVKVTASAPFQTLMKVPGFPQALSLKSVTRMRIE